MHTITTIGAIVSVLPFIRYYFNYNDEQILEIDLFLKSYAELIDSCFSSKIENESGKVIEMNKNQNNLKAA